ncbi:hypothetical protein B0H19DRAFT_67993 [Mycena capillaripes]|nr:hypothetical protein B0H19DRAFT_67993 [Mycena capillaripes]
MGGAALLGLFLLPGVPLLIIWIIIKRVTAEPYKTSWARRKRLAIRTTGGVFLYLLALECISLYAPLRSAPVLQRLVWQAGPLSRAGKWFGLCVYGVSTLWICTNHTGGYFVYRGARRVGAKITPPPQTRLQYLRVYSSSCRHGLQRRRIRRRAGHLHDLLQRRHLGRAPVYVRYG